MFTIRHCFEIFVKLFCITTTIPVVTSVDISTDIERIKFYLYPKPGNTNYREEIQYRNTTSLTGSSFKPGLLTVFIFHGYNQNADSPKFKILTDAYINSPFNGNYIVVDYGALAGKLHFPTDNVLLYPIAVGNVPTVARRLTDFLTWLVRVVGVLDLNKVHLIGHSLGAHIAGQSGILVQNELGIVLPRITGLDPAGPLFWPPEVSRNINKNDAQFVDIIHTNAYEAGEKTVEGHVDFLINDGTTQPGCDLFSNILSSCSHDFGIKLYAATFTRAYVGCKCSTEGFNIFNFQNCMAKCPNPTFVGVYTPHTARGVYTAITGPL